MTLRTQSLAKLATLPERRASYHDASGYVFLDVLVSEAKPDWTELTSEQAEAVQPLTSTDRRKWNRWHAKDEASMAYEPKDGET